VSEGGIEILRGDGQRGRAPARAWTEADDRELRERLAARQQTATIATAMRSTVDAIRGRAQVLGLTLTQRMRPWRSLPAARPEEQEPE
jgi:hypothetical protein